MNKVRIACLALMAVALACSNGSGTNDGGTDATNEVSGNTFTQTGTIVDFDNKSPIYDIIVNAGGSSATTDSKGNYTVSVPQNTAYSMQIVGGADAGKTYVSLDEQEWKLTGNAVRGKTSFVSAGTEGLLTAILAPKPDPMLAVLSISVYATGACSGDAGGADVTGATISVPGLNPDASGGPILVYFMNGLPSSTATSVQAGQLPSAIIYNMPPNASFSGVTVKHPTCQQKAFPINDLSEPNIVYTGNVKLEVAFPPGQPEVVSFMRVFIE